jgi:histidyl-tRNA synthetase
VSDASFRIKRDGQPIKRLATQLQHHMAQYGYQLIELPIIEQAELFLTKAGDKVAERLFRFERHSSQLALRPEFTAAAAHLYTTQQEDSTVRWQFSGPVFEDNPYEKAPQYQQYNAGAELIGAGGPAAEAEIIAMAVQGLTEQGIDDWSLVIGHVGLTRRLLSKFELDPRTQHFILSHRDALKTGSKGKVKMLSALARYLPEVKTPLDGGATMTQSGTQEMLDVLLNTSRSSATMGGRSRHDIARRLLKKRQQAAQRNQVNDAIYFLQGWMNIRSGQRWAMDDIEDFIGFDEIARGLFDEWNQVMTLLDAYGIDRERIIIQPDLVRTWDYYTGLVFEIRTEDGVQLAGGGRYDELTRLVGGSRDVPAVGFVYQVDHLADYMPETRESGSRLFTLIEDGSQSVAGARWAGGLRKRGLSVILTQNSAEQPANSAVVLHITEDGSILLGDQRYTYDRIDHLVKTLNG